MQTIGMDAVGAVVVHHKSYGTVAGVVEAIVAAGLNRRNVVVVDNSEEPDRRSELASSLQDTRLVYSENRGYAAAVNEGVAELAAIAPAYVLVSTHESMPEPEAIALLGAALDADPRAGVAGPTLLTGNDAGVVWSRGGKLTSVLRLPRHHGHDELDSEIDASGPVAREWLDGAFLMYRSAAIARRPMNENYFLYMEEVDYHLVLAEAGWSVLYVPGARVWQSSSGIPAYWLGRNMHLFQRAHGTSVSRLFATGWSIAHRTASRAAHRRETELPSMLRGWRDGIADKTKERRR